MLSDKFALLLCVVDVSSTHSRSCSGVGFGE
jgi:hypothetical protein